MGHQEQTTKYRGHDIQVWQDLSKTGKVDYDSSRTLSKSDTKAGIQSYYWVNQEGYRT